MSDVSQSGAEPGPRASRRLKYALIASLALNLLIVGVVGGTMFGFGKHHPTLRGHPRGEDFGLMGLTRTLPEARRKEIRKELRDDRVRLRPLIDDIRASRRDAAEKLAAEPFDRAAVESALGAVSDKERALRQEAVGIFLSHVERLTVDERRTLANWWRKKSEPLPKRKSKKGEGEDRAEK